jgi:hypothetical protein
MASRSSTSVSCSRLTMLLTRGSLTVNQVRFSFSVRSRANVYPTFAMPCVQPTSAYAWSSWSFGSDQIAP